MASGITPFPAWKSRRADPAHAMAPEHPVLTDPRSQPSRPRSGMTGRFGGNGSCNSVLSSAEMTSVSHIATNRTLISPRGGLAANGCDILPGIAIRMPHPLNSAGCPQAGNPGVSSPWAAICELRSPPAITGKHIYATSSIRQMRSAGRQAK